VVATFSLIVTIISLFSTTVALTKTEKRSTREHKSSLIEEVRKAIDEYDTIYVFSYENMRSTKFKNIRLHFRDETKKSRIFLGKNKLLQIAMGRTPEEEYSDNLRHMSKLIVGGSVGLFFTCQPREDVESYFASLKKPDFARAGSIANREAVVTNEMLQHFPSSMMEPFRKLGLPVEIRTGIIVLRDNSSEYRICKMGDTLSAEKCKLLVHFGLQLTDFQVKLVARWSDGAFEELT
jgi:mRNA turnover protein 4